MFPTCIATSRRRPLGDVEPDLNNAIDILVPWRHLSEQRAQHCQDRHMRPTVVTVEHGPASLFPAVYRPRPSRLPRAGAHVGARFLRGGLDFGRRFGCSPTPGLDFFGRGLPQRPRIGPRTHVLAAQRDFWAA